MLDVSFLVQTATFQCNRERPRFADMLGGETGGPCICFRSPHAARKDENARNRSLASGYSRSPARKGLPKALVQNQNAE
jgi:hypothetical protein